MAMEFDTPSVSPLIHFTSTGMTVAIEFDASGVSPLIHFTSTGMTVAIGI